MVEELKRCPFCGQETKMGYDRVSDIEYIICGNCNAVVHFGAGLTVEQTVQHYNERVKEESEVPLKTHRGSKKKGTTDES